MSVLSTVLPVFFMIFLGAFARLRRLVTSAQTDGMSQVVNRILFPVMVFNALFTSGLQRSAAAVVGFVFLAHLAAMGLGFLLRRAAGGRFGHLSPFLMATVDGGNVCYPLYAAIVGAEYIGNVVLLDLACMLVVFLVIPILVSAQADRADRALRPGPLLRSILRDPVVLSILLGLGLNLLGVRTFLERAGWLELYSAVVSTATAPIVGCILFRIGFYFRLEKSSLGPLARCIALRAGIMAGVIALFFLLFPTLTADPAFRALVPLYFLCPPALVLPSQLQPLMRTEEDSSFASAFLSLYMVVTLTAFPMIAAFF